MKKQWVLAAALIAAFAATNAHAQHTTPIQQPTTTDAAKAPTGEVQLGSVRLPRSVMADGKSLPAGTYQVRLTADEARPDAVGLSQQLYRWAEFVQGGNVRGREVVTIVPAGEAQYVVQDAPPAPGGAKVQMLRGNDYLRVWINRGGNHYLIHFPVGMN